MKPLEAIQTKLAAYRRYFFRANLVPFYAGLFIFASLIATSVSIATHADRAGLHQVSAVDKQFTDLNYDLNKIRRKEARVPRIFLTVMPVDFNMQESANDKRNMFIKIMLPLILQENEAIAARRARFIELSKKKSLSDEEREFMNAVYEHFSKSRNNDEVMTKLDEMSPSLALAQAIQETGWGTSRFLMDGNSIFAEWTWGGEGMLPRTRKEGMKHRIRTFPTLADSVCAYALNLNRTRHYYGLRLIREELRKADKPLRGEALANGLKSYSTESSYIENLRQIVIKNRLNDFNDAKLAPEETAKEPPPSHVIPAKAGIREEIK